MCEAFAELAWEGQAVTIGSPCQHLPELPFPIFLSYTEAELP